MPPPDGRDDDSLSDGDVPMESDDDRNPVPNADNDADDIPVNGVQAPNSPVVAPVPGHRFGIRLISAVLPGSLRADDNFDDFPQAQYLADDSEDELALQPVDPNDVDNLPLYDDNLRVSEDGDISPVNSRRSDTTGKVAEMQELFRTWEASYTETGYDPTPVLTRLCTLLEAETEKYIRNDPDPFDERHPSRTDPNCELGRMLKLLFRRDTFMTRLVSDYMRDNFFTRQTIDRSSTDLNVAACRLILVIMPGLEASAVFQVEFDSLIHRLYAWAENADEPLRNYAVGLIAAAMDVQDIAVNFREQNTRLIAASLRRLHVMHEATVAARPQNGTKEAAGEPAVYVRTGVPLHPPTSATYQMLLLRYLTSMGEYQEFLGTEFEHNALQLIYAYIVDVDNEPDTCLTFEALKYLSSLLCHKKCALEFIALGGLEALLRVPRPSIASTGVSITLYYLAYCEDAMERICQMSPRIVHDTVEYALWLLSSSHDSARCHATMFFGLAVQFKVMLDEFDSREGLNRVLGIMAAMPILGIEGNMLNDDEECSERQLVRHVCQAVRRYMEAHLFYKYTSVTRMGASDPTFTAVAVTRAPKSSAETMSEQVRVLQEMLPHRAHWDKVEKALSLNLISMLLRVIAYSYDWNYSGSYGISTSHRADTVRSALEIIMVCCVLPRVHLECCERLDMPDEVSSEGINIILSAAEGEIVSDAEVQKAALAVLVHITCAPVVKPQAISRIGSSRKKCTNKHAEDMLVVCWESVRRNNGIIVLLQLMEAKLPITDADCLRGMACRALAGLARSPTVRQIIGKLPMFTSGQLQALMRDPILQEKRAEHVQFQKYALELMERISGRSHTGGQLDASIANIHRANVVAHTRIQFNETQLHQLIHEHLVARGLTETAASLKREAKLQTPPAAGKPLSDHHHTPFAFRSPVGRLLSSRSRQRYRLTSDFNASLHAKAAAAASQPPASALDEPVADEPEDVEPPVLITPIKIVKKLLVPPLSGPSTPAGAGDKTPQPRSLQKQISAVDALPVEPIVPVASKTNVTLDAIVTEYLTNQHALCRNPVSTCPQFDLFVPHKCPDPRPQRASGQVANFAMRHFRRQAGFASRRLDRRQVHLNFCVARTIRSPIDSDCFFSSCDFTPCSSSLIVGAYTGEVRVFNINDCVEEFSYNCHDSLVTSIVCNRQGNLVLTSNTWRAPLSALWNIENKQFTLKCSYTDEEYTEFSNVTQDKVLGTKSEVASIYDLHTGQKVTSFTPVIYNQYTKNRATFNPTDELILSDGVLWDVRMRRELHKFDKLNLTMSGVFHPNGLEVISNSEVWDLRTFHLLRTVPALDQCRVRFSSQNVVYGITPDIENNLDLEVTRTFDTSFRALDAYDFSSIATVDVKRNIYDLAVNSFGSQIAIAENQGDFDAVQESVVRLYNVGRRKTADDECEEDDNDVEMSEDESASDGEPNIYGLRDNDRRDRRRLHDDLLDNDDDHRLAFSSSSSATSSRSSTSSSSDDDTIDDAIDVLQYENARRPPRRRVPLARQMIIDVNNGPDDDMWETDENDNDDY